MFVNINMHFWIELFADLYFLLISESVHRRAEGESRLQHVKKPSLRNEFFKNSSVSQVDTFYADPIRHSIRIIYMLIVHTPVIFKYF